MEGFIEVGPKLQLPPSCVFTATCVIELMLSYYSFVKC